MAAADCVLRASKSVPHLIPLYWLVVKMESKWVPPQVEPYMMLALYSVGQMLLLLLRPLAENNVTLSHGQCQTIDMNL